MLYAPPFVPTWPGLRPAAAFSSCSRQIHDVDQLAPLFPSWDMRFVQFGRGAFTGFLRYVKLPGMEFKGGRGNREVLLRGYQRTPSFTFTVVDEHSEGWRRWGRRIPAGNLQIMAAGVEIDHLAVVGPDVDDIMVEPATLREAASVLLRRDLEEVMPSELAVTPPPEVLGALRAEIRRTFEMCSLLPPSDVTQDVVESLGSRCLVALCQVFEDRDRPARIRLPAGERLKVARQAEQLMEKHQVRPLTALALCRALCVSRRTLFYAFQDVFGMTPMAYYKIKRINRVRQELKASDTATTSVGVVARNNGFYHAGQFAQDYLRQFGERPSQTLNRLRGAERTGAMADETRLRLGAR